MASRRFAAGYRLDGPALPVPPPDKPRPARRATRAPGPMNPVYLVGKLTEASVAGYGGCPSCRKLPGVACFANGKNHQARWLNARKAQQYLAGIGKLGVPVPMQTRQMTDEERRRAFGDSPPSRKVRSPRKRQDPMEQSNEALRLRQRAIDNRP